MFHTAKLGFGMMRLPLSDGGRIDIPQVERMTDRFLAEGFTYFDTAWAYLDGRSEGVVRDVLVRRHPRARFLLADKMPIWLLQSSGDVRRIFDTQLSRTGAGHFDYYLAHALSRDRLKAMDEFGVWDFMARMKQKGCAHHIGLSFHDDAQCLDEILSAHPEMEFVQLQINYADWESDTIQSRKCYEVAQSHGKPVVVMEPVKGGRLADLPQRARAILEAERPGASCASWALRYAASLPGVTQVLSGMSDIHQMEDNLSVMRDAEPLNPSEQAALWGALEAMFAIPTVGCTACRYCVEDCPAHINIPAAIAAWNAIQVFGLNDGTRQGLIDATHKASPAACIACKACEAVCPQHLSIAECMARIAERLH